MSGSFRFEFTADGWQARIKYQLHFNDCKVEIRANNGFFFSPTCKFLI